MSWASPRNSRSNTPCAMPPTSAIGCGCFPIAAPPATWRRIVRRFAPCRCWPTSWRAGRRCRVDGRNRYQQSGRAGMFKDGLLRGRRILVTGGGTGLGKGMAEKFLALGAEVFICGRRKSVCDETAAELVARHGGKVRSFGLDIRDPAAVDAMVADIFASE